MNRSWVGIALLALLCALFGAVRWAGAQNDLWLDEIWSLDNAGEVKRFGDILMSTALRHDNNHPLNTLWLWCVLRLGLNPDLWARMLAVFCGALTITVAGAIGAMRACAGRSPRQPVEQPGQQVRDTWFGAGMAIVIVGGSYLLIHYGSEARGYGPAVLFSLAGWLLALAGLGRHAEGQARQNNNTLLFVPCYWIAIALALLSHATAVHVLAGVAAWSAVRCVVLANSCQGDRIGLLPRIKRALSVWLWWNLVPLGSAAAYYFLFLRHLQIGGGPLRPLGDVIGSAGAYTLGLPASVSPATALAVVAGVLAVVIATIAVRRTDSLVFYAVAALASPAAVLIVTGHVVLFERYFIIPAALLLLLLADVLTSAVRASRWAWIPVSALVALFLLGNAAHTRELLRDGRGRYTAAIRHMIERRDRSTITLNTDHFHRNHTILRHYDRMLPDGVTLLHNGTGPVGRPIQWILPADAENTIPQRHPSRWVLQHAWVRLDMQPRIETRQGAYRLVRHFPTSGLSGWHWYLYQLDEKDDDQ